MNLSYYFVGNVKISVSYEQAPALLNLCMYYCIPYADFTLTESGVEMRFKFTSLKRLLREAVARGIELEIIERRGLAALFWRYRHRFGILVGALIAAALVFLSQSFIWDIDVVGNESITSSEIRELLDDYGFSVGSYIPSINTDRIENKILIDTERISWISINIQGNVAEVQVREYDGAQERNEVTNPANLVAKKSGIVEEVRIYRGNVIVSAGQFVEEGDLLVSGLFDSERVGFRYTRASGQVMARTTTEYFIEIPYEYRGIVYTGEEYCDKYLNFFDFSINISKNYGKEGALYDKIDIVENYSFPDGVPTPLELQTVRYLEYEEKDMRRTEEEAEELAYFELSRQLGEMAHEGIIIRKTITPRVGEDSFSLYCVVVSIEDIASVSEFEVDITDE